MADAGHIIEELVAALEEVRTTAWRAYFHSWKAKEKKRKEFAPLKDAGKKGKESPGKIKTTIKLLKAVNESEGRLPANEFLHTIIETIKEEGKLRGVYLDIKVDAGGLMPVDWDRMRMLEQPDDPMLTLEAEVLSSKPSANGRAKEER
jgi:hypothetical protein